MALRKEGQLYHAFPVIQALYQKNKLYGVPPVQLREILTGEGYMPLFIIQHEPKGMCDARLQTFNVYFTTGTSFWWRYCVGDQSTDCSFTFIFWGMKAGAFVNLNNKKFQKETKYCQILKVTSLITFEITCSNLWGKKTVNCLDKIIRKPLTSTNVNETQFIPINFQQHDVVFSSKIGIKIGSKGLQLFNNN